MGISPAGQKSICSPTLSEASYAVRVQDRNAFRTYLDQMIAAYPELFPASIGYPAALSPHQSLVQKADGQTLVCLPIDHQGPICSTPASAKEMGSCQGQAENGPAKAAEFEGKIC